MASETINVIFKADDKQLKGSLNGLRSTLKDFTGVAGVMAGSLAAIVHGFEAAVTPLIDYNKAMKDGAAATGIAVEEYSRLVQAADDMAISQETIEKAMAMAVKNGFQPTVENLGKLSEELSRMNSPTKKAAALAQIFGRGWADIVPLLDLGAEGLREITDAQADGLVVTEKEIRATETLRLRIDTIKDAWQAMKNEALGPAIQTMAEVIDIQDQLGEQYVYIKGGLGGMTEAQLAAKAAFDEYAKGVQPTLQQAFAMRDALEDVAGAANGLADATEGVTAAQYLMQAAEAAIQGDWNRSNVFIDMYRDAKIAERQLLALKTIIEMGARPGPWMIHMGTIRGPGISGSSGGGGGGTPGKLVEGPGGKMYRETGDPAHPYEPAYSGGFAARASGGLLGTLVGERGPEMITPGGWVKTAGQTENALGLKESVSEMRAIRDDIRWMVRQLPTTIRDVVQMAQ